MRKGQEVAGRDARWLRIGGE